jgi:hypothetical protein
VFEGFIALMCLFVVFLILFIAFAVMYSQKCRQLKRLS